MKKIFCDGQISKAFRENNLTETNRFFYNPEHGSLTVWKESICKVCEHEFMVGEATMIVDAHGTPWNHLLACRKPRPAPPERTSEMSDYCSDCYDKHMKVS